MLQSSWIRKLTIALAVIIFINGGFLFFVQQVKAQAVAVTTTAADIPRGASETKSTIKETFLQALTKAGRVSFLNSLRSLVNKFAYDTATYLGSGGKGQKPVYFTENFGPWLRDQAFNAGGQFIEEFAQTPEGDFIKKYNVCAPDLAVNIKIALGLTDFAGESQGLQQSRCNLKTIYENGRNKVALYKDPQYLKNLAITAFDPTTTDVGAAFTLFNQVGYKVIKEKEGLTLMRLENGGWVPATDTISDKTTTPPAQAAKKLEQAEQLQTENFFTQTGDIFVDAANIFLNQLALSAFNKLIDGLSRRNSSLNTGSTSDYYSQGNTGGITELTRRNSSILQARFNERVDYDILSQLSSCPDESKAGPTNCVITEAFAQAISDHLTVAEAINRNILDATKRLGFNAQGSNLSYLEGYPYRSLVILRKYRILPVGWEVAAQYIKDNASATKDITLGDLINCFDPNDTSYPGLQEEWCRGLIDPNWVLKVPKQYCGMEGYGPEIIQDQVTTSGVGYCAVSDTANCDARGKNTDGGCNTNYVTCFNKADCRDYTGFPECNFTIRQDHQLVRNNTYCADEQSCIKENANGSCAYYGYCTEEKRRWVFNQENDNSCEARNNTCQIFKNDNGQQAAFLENTLNYDNCDANQVGCKQYALTGPYDAATKKIAWSSSGAQAFFNKNMNQCKNGSEGCHQFIRISDDLDTNLIPDGSFEKSVCVSSGTGTVSQGAKPEEKAVSIFGSLVKSAYAQTLEGDCELETFTAPINKLAAPNDQWYILVNNGTVKAGIVNTQASDGSQSLYVEGEGGWYSQEGGGTGVIRYSVLPNNFVMEGGHYYTLSARVFVKEGRAYAGFGYSGTDHIESTATNQWQTLRVTYYKPVGSTVSNYFVAGRTPNTKFYVDSVKLTMGRAVTDYNEYGQNNVIYEKLLPNYLAATCYDTGGREPYTLKANAPDECKKFVRQCNDSEVGCQAYTAVASGLTITGKAQTADYCPASCVGYNTFVQQPNAFNPRQAFNFIPTTARRCSAQAVGCTAFTNLDKIGQGGEAIEYYSALRKCIKPDTTRCAAFYTWEGSDESGYQLKVFSLQKDVSTRGEEPLSTLPSTEEALLCNATVFQKLPTEAGYNYDCRQFYAQDGTVSYHLLEKTISCSDDCHPYRRELTNAASCMAAGGDWDATQNRCLYYAIPGEGKTCAASDAGCSEYTGNIASNTRNIFTPSISTFEDINDPTFEGWSSRSSITRSNTSLNLGGHSLLSDLFVKSVANNVTQNRSYNLTFLARSSTGGIVNVDVIKMINDNSESVAFNATGSAITPEWKLYSFDLPNLDHNPSGEKIELDFSNPIYIDNIKLTEVPNRYYLIRNSWTTPAECDQDFSGASAPGYMLGCSQYKKSDNRVVNLHSFSDLCSDSSAGCEAMIDTHNSTDPKKKLVNDTNNNGSCDATERGCIETPADSVINVIYDPSKFCGQENKGCQRVGRGTTYDSLTTFADAYVLNNPDQYTTTVCKAEAVGCSKWTSPAGDAYFKDPGNEVCEWRLKSGTANEYHWYEKRVSRCGGTTAGTLCTDSNQCSSGQSCELLDEDIECALTPHKTLGEGGQAIMQPSEWAGTCESTQAGCTELVDPVSSFNPNILRNPTYQAGTGGTTVDFWEEITDVGTPLGGTAVQNNSLGLYTTYILKGSDSCIYDNGRGGCTPADEVYISNCVLDNAQPGETAVIYQLNDRNNLFERVTSTYSGVTSGSDRSLEFYVASSNPANSSADSVTCSVWRKNRTKNKNVQLRQAVVGYQLRQNLDTQSPNGLTSYSKGYVLFNQRIQSGNRKVPVTFNADETGDGGTDGTTPKNVSRPFNANVIINVQADRTCSKWLDCSSYIPDPNDPRKQTCLEVGLCDSLNSEGQCNHFIEPATKKNQNLYNLGDASRIANLTGYSKVGYYRNLTGRGGLYASSVLGDYYDLANMQQVGESVSLINSDFEFSDADSFRKGWIDLNTPDAKFIFLQPQQFISEGISIKSIHALKNRNGSSSAFLPPSGNGLAKLVNPSTIEQKQFVGLQSGKIYTISAYVYNKGGTGQVKLTYAIPSDPDRQEEVIIDTSNDKQNEWLHKAAVFKVPAGSDYNIQLSTLPGGEVYFDLIAIESGMNFRCADPQQDPSTCLTPEYLPSSCRLYPTEDALSCEHTDSNNTIHKGLKGYCLEYDPNFPDTCLLWYPLDKIASDQTEEGLGLNLEDLSYCLEAEPYCPTRGSLGTGVSWPNLTWRSSTPHRRGGGIAIEDPVAAGYNVYGGLSDGISIPFFSPNSEGESPDKPVYRCTKFARVDKDKYWRTRLVSGSSYKLDSGNSKEIKLPPAQGGTLNPLFLASNYYKALVNYSFNPDEAVKFKNTNDLNQGTPYINTIDSLTCKGLLHTYDDREDKCTVHEVSILGDWQTCSPTPTNNAGNGCEPGFQSNAELRGTTWYAQTTDHQDSDDWPYPPEADFKCSSNTDTLYNRTKSTNPKDALLSSLFVKTSKYYVWTGTRYNSQPGINIPTSICGTGGTTLYPSYCTGAQTVSCTSALGCVGKGTCFMRRPSLTTSGLFNYNTDYCYIEPTVYDYTVNGLKNQLAVTDGSREVTFAFNTKTDPDQLPLRKITIDFGYKLNELDPKNQGIELTGDLGDSLRYFKKVLSYDGPSGVHNSYEYFRRCANANSTVGTTGISCGAKPCCVIKPKVLITDNWDKCNGDCSIGGFAPANAYIRIDQN